MLALAACPAARYRVRTQEVCAVHPRLCCVTLVLGLAGAAVVHAQTAPAASPAVARPAPVTAPEEEAAEAAASVKAARQALVAERFDDLEAMAAQYRTGTRLPGGDWMLRSFYAALDSPRAGDTTMPDHLLHLQHWTAAKPQSAAAATALAQSLTRWAWQARGNGKAETVTLDGWMQFGERLADAKKALDAVPGAATRTVADPQWFAAYMTVALGLDWKNDRMKALFDQAVAAYPTYVYLYKQYANYLLPKWDGEPGDAAFFAKSAADSLPGSDGDMLYYQIGTTLLSRSNSGFPHRTLDWQRLQRGHAALVARYGSTRRIDNEFALMAFRERDAVIAQQGFAAIGDGWSKSVWRDRIYFDRARDWAGAAQAGATPAPSQGLIPLGPQ